MPVLALVAAKFLVSTAIFDLGSAVQASGHVPYCLFTIVHPCNFCIKDGYKNVSCKQREVDF